MAGCFCLALKRVVIRENFKTLCRVLLDKDGDTELERGICNYCL